MSIKGCVEPVNPIGVNEMGLRTKVKEKMEEKFAKVNASMLSFVLSFVFKIVG